MKKNISLLILSIGIVGCASPSYNYQAVPKNISKPPIGSVNKAFVGDQMLEQGIVVDREVLNVPENIKISFAYSLTSGIYLKTGQNEKGQYFQPFNTVSGGGMVQKNPLADPFKVVMFDNEGKLCVVTVFNAKNCTDKHQA
ncbi:putative lipo domain protein [Acinetobacter baumannii]|nr:putative lipo domain protein [Acinetobacter baumannii]AVI36345.1 putative lipo domain protein [Acinetobacter baumannii]